MTLLEDALAWHAAGASIVPTRNDGSKAPAAFWERYQHERATAEQITTWLGLADYDGFGVICGEISGNLEMLEFEGRATHLVSDFAAALTDNGLEELWQRLTAHGRVESTPSGGIHLHYTVTDAPAARNTRLARRPSTDDELADWKTRETAKAATIDDPELRTKRLAKIAAATNADVPQVLIETRGEGGFTVLAPSAGRTHPTGNAWTALTGHPGAVPAITVDERDILFAIAATFDEMPARTGLTSTTPTAGQTAPDGSLRPGDDYNARTTWDDILTPHGWTKAKRLGAGYGWTRPGKNAIDGISATTGTAADGVDRLYVFSSSTEFETEVPYTKFAAYALLEHAGDLSAAAKQLAKDGYGEIATRLGPDPLLEGLPTEGNTPWPTSQTNAAAPSTANTDGSTNPPPSTASTSPSASPAEPKNPQAHSPAEPRDAAPNEDNTALLLVDQHINEIRYCPERGEWLTWTGHHWAWDKKGHVQELTRRISRRLPTGEGWTSYVKHALSARGVSGIMRLAATDARIVAPIKRLDAHPYELNTPAGIINLKTGELTPPDPDRLHTKTTAYSPDPSCPTPLWDKFLADTFAGDPDLTVYMQRMLGVSLVGAVIEQQLPLAHGSGQNGKSVLFETVQDVVGLAPEGYALSIPAEMLTTRGRDDHPATIAQLQGVRLAVGGEIEEGARFAEAKIKMLTGGDPINARFMGKNPFTFIPTHSLWLHANHQPEVRAGGPAFWRRIRQIPFLHVVPEEARDKTLGAKLINQEAPGILAWLIQGAADYFTHGIQEPASVIAATAAYQHDTDTIAQFVDERCQTGPTSAQHMHVRTSELRHAYEQWCRAEGLEAVSARALTQQLRARFGVMQSRSSTSRFYDGIRLIEVSSEQTEPEPDEGQLDFDPTDRGGW